jgi:hypothetical protein
MEGAGQENPSALAGFQDIKKPSNGGPIKNGLGYDDLVSKLEELRSVTSGA